jgi:sterol desaturase/sphingolipid hydroxylase (fatty acid hydroxylase superfamily)
MELITHYGHSLFVIVYGVIENFLPIAVLGTVLEFLIPGERQTVQSRLRGIFFFTLYICIGSFLAEVTKRVMWEAGIRPMTRVDLTVLANSDDLLVRYASLILLPIGFAIFHDFFFYWFHRAQHAVPFLWRLHRTHHSIEEMNVMNCYHHASELPLEAMLVSVPVTLFVNISVDQAAMTIFFMLINGHIVHSNTQLRYGPFKYLFAEPRFHRIHHSIEERHFDKNFCATYPVWDMLFGTAYFPKPDETHKTGLSDMREPRSILEWFWPTLIARADEHTRHTPPLASEANSEAPISQHAPGPSAPTTATHT